MMEEIKAVFFFLLFTFSRLLHSSVLLHVWFQMCKSSGTQREKSLMDPMPWVAAPM